MLQNYNFLTNPIYILDPITLLALCKDLHKNKGVFDDIFGGNNQRATGIISLKALPFKLGSYTLEEPEFSGYKNITYDHVSEIDIYAKDKAVGGIHLDVTSGSSTQRALRVNSINGNEPIYTFEFSETELSFMLNGRYTDYPAFSKYELYLPFVGYEEIDYFYIRNCRSIRIEYYLDYSTAVMVCNVIADLPHQMSHRIKEYSIPIGQDLTISYTDYTQFNAAMIMMISKGVNLLTKALFPTGTSSSNSVSSMTTDVNRHMNDLYSLQKLNKNTGRLRTTEKHQQEIDDVTTTTKQGSSQRDVEYRHNPVQEISSVIDGLAQFSNSISGSSIHASNNMNTYSNSLTKPFIFVRHPTWNYYDEFNHSFGRLLGEYRPLSSLRGFTKVSSVHLQISATTEEIHEIERLLLSGVIITSNPVPEVPEEPSTGTTDTPSDNPSSGGTFTPVEPIEPIEPIEPETKWLSPWSGSFRVTSTYGEKRTYTATDGKVYTDVHQGLDMVGIGDINIYSIAEGTVEHIGWQNASNPSAGFGYYCRVNTNGKLFYYAHMRADSSTLKVGDTISKGTKIGVMGSTGQVTGAHLHLEVRGSTASSSHENICSYTLLPNEIGTYE